VKRASSRGHELSTHQDEVQASTSLQQPPAPSQGNENEDCDTTSNDNTAASSAADGTDNTTDSTHVVRVKQEDTTTNDNTQQQQVSIKQEPMEEDNTNTNNNEEEDNDELVNIDEKASCALKVLLDLDAGSLLCDDLKSKIMKVQEVCSSDAPSLQQQLSAMEEEIKRKNKVIKDMKYTNNILTEQMTDIERVKVQGALVTADSSTKSTTKEQTSPSVLSDESDAFANTSAIASSSTGNSLPNSSSSSSEDESNLKPAANPLIGSNVQVQSGKHKGAFGKVLSDRLGWIKIKPEYKLGWVKIKPSGVPELNVRIENCKLVNDGKADIDAIKRYFVERTRQMMEVIQPEELDLLEGDSEDEEEDEGSIVAGRGPNGGAEELVDSDVDNEDDDALEKQRVTAKKYPYIHQRASGKWNAQVYYAGKARFIGYFCTQETALLAQEAASEVLKNVTDTTDIETIDKNVVMARIAASRKVCHDEVPSSSNKSEDVSDKRRVTAAIEAVNTKYGVGLKRQKMLESSGHRGVTWTPQGVCK